MADSWLSNLQEQIRAMTPARRAAFAATAVGSLAFFLWLALAVGGADERVLYRGLEEDEAARVIEALQAERVPYRLDEGGTAIYVPAAQVYEARIRLAGKGLPSGALPGFEIFDETGFGVTDFVNRVNYQRALQGELARSIEQLEAVDRARVQVAVPDRDGYLASREREASASVVVRLREGLDLEASMARGIVHLVASSVEGLDASRVTLVDQRGRMLSPDREGEAGPAPSNALRHQTKVERELARRIESILEPTVGPGQVVARVAATLDWTQSESTEERFDPDSQVARSEEIVSESASDGSAGASGVPGIASNSPDLAGGAIASGGSGGGTSRTSETINYEISKTVSRSVAPVGSVKQLDVAVLVGDPVGEGGQPAPWDAESLTRFEDLAKRAVGFSLDRGDRITVTSAPFREFDFGDEAGGWLRPELLLLASTVLRFAGIVVALVLFAKLVVGPLLPHVGGPLEGQLPMSVDEAEMQLAAAGPAGAALSAPEGGAEEVAQVPAPPEGEEAAKALRVWLSER